MDKNSNISESYRNTLQKRRGQVCAVRSLKISDMNDRQAEWIKMCFVEAKWCYNWILDQIKNNRLDIFSFDYKLLDKITHKDKDGNDVEVKITHLSAQVKQKLVDCIKSSIKTLSSLKKKGKKVGALKFKSDWTSLDFKQYLVTWRFDNKNKIKFQGCKKAFRILGDRQLDKYKSVEFANAKLVKKPSGYFINITCFIDKDEWWSLQKRNYKNKIIGIDFGCQTALTFSDGTKLNASVEEPDRLKHLQRLLMKKQKGSNNRHKLSAKIRREYEKLSNKKDDLANKIIAKVLQENELIIMQDEQINSWKKNHGKKIQHGILGRVKSRLLDDRYKDQVVCLSRWIPTTKFCNACGRSHDELALFDRTFKCECGVKADRDIHAAQNMIWFYDNIIGVECAKFKLLDFRSALENYFSRNTKLKVE